MFWRKKSIEDKIKAKVSSTLSKKVADRINEHITRCIEYTPDEKTSPATGDSKAGGVPHFLSSSFIPQYQGRPLKLLMQINCADLVTLENFPHEGMLYIFLDVVDEATSFPEKEGQFKVLYLPVTSVDTQTSSSAEVGYKRTPIETFRLHESKSYIFEGIEVSDADFYGLMNLSYGAIEEIVGKGGSIRVGGAPDMRAVWSWACQYLGYVDEFGVTDWARVEAAGEEAKNKVEQILQDFELIYTEILDDHGHTDSWIFIGIHKDDLKNRAFEKALAAFDAS